VRLRFVSAARRDLLDSALYLDEREPGLGTRFLDEVDRALALIREHPRAWNPIGRDLRRCRLLVFPYGLIYRIRDETIEIIAVAHDRRRPGYWRGRLRNSG
jgi:plasmid stabilization system protein ParE